MPQTFEPNKLYKPDDPEMRMLGKVKTLANWRSAGRGPRWSKLGGAVRYCGSDLNAWLAETLVEAA